ncbi:C-C motif chemokine ligand 20 isoform X2 [Takifugu rubripes]|uniref:C-C motif chemokine ligand 20 isoform X2 n=1 Tax=Takifugu rubripes TaxID=31033 RepID=UPI0005D2606E|nr:C-C motif chemokine ligand 20 isoform X2 [Takifugu rubripes]|eukprot:XP_011614809.1 PREDICTED: C-C motif chemokine ligand 20 isoform X1 [Takifugu rubripes]
MITVTTFVLCFVLALTPAPYACSHASRSCCTRYSGKPVPPQLIRGYREHTAMENCRIEAIIFYTVQRKMVCANPKDEWVKKVLKLLSSKLRRLSKGKP